MSESTLSLTLEDLRDEVADFLRWGDGDYSALEVGGAEQDRIDRIIRRGLRLFLNPPPLRSLDGTNAAAHRWSFVTPSAEISTFVAFSSAITELGVYEATVAGETTVTMTAATFLAVHVGQPLKFGATGNQYLISSFTSTNVVQVTGDASGETATDTCTIDNDDLLLPDDFGGMDSSWITFDSSTDRPKIELQSEARIRDVRQRTVTATRPDIAAIRPAPFTAFAGGAGAPTLGQRWHLQLWPAPDQTYVLGYRYLRLFDVITSTQFFYGGAFYGETLLLACLSIAEQRRNQDQGGGAKYQHDLFIESLAGAISHDEKQGAHHFGKNYDDSDNRGNVPRRSQLTSATFDATLNDGRY